MKNPYEVLGIKEGASIDEIKAAYKKQVKKYHPDRHHNNPLYELAEERLREINEAYDTLMNNRSAGQTYTRTTSSASGDYRQIRMDLDRGNLSRAETLLGSIKTRGAEWHFLFGMLQMKKGWYDDAITNIQLAISMDPGNVEYNQALNTLLMRSGSFRTTSYQRGYTSEADELCRMMQCCCCTNLLCDCF